MLRVNRVPDICLSALINPAAVAAAAMLDSVCLSDIAVVVPLVSASDQVLLAPIVRVLRLHCDFSLRAWREIFGAD